MSCEQVNDGRAAILGGARLVESDAVGEIFVDLPSGEVVAVVARMVPDGAVRVQVMNRHSARLEVFVEGEQVHPSALP